MQVRVNEEDRSIIVRWKARCFADAVEGAIVAEENMPTGYRMEKISLTVPNHGGKAKNVLFVLWHVDGSKPFFNRAEAAKWAEPYGTAERGASGPPPTPGRTTATPTAGSASEGPKPAA